MVKKCLSRSEMSLPFRCYEWQTGKMRLKQIPSGGEDVHGLIARRLKVLKCNLDDLLTNGSKKENDGKCCFHLNWHPHLKRLSPTQFVKKCWKDLQAPFTTCHFSQHLEAFPLFPLPSANILGIIWPSESHVPTLGAIHRASPADYRVAQAPALGRWWLKYGWSMVT